MDRRHGLRIEPPFWVQTLFSLALVTLGLSVLGGCSQPSEQVPSSGLTNDSIPTISANDLPPLICEGKACDRTGLGQLVTLGFRGFAFCTVSRIDADTVLTASHCLPGELLEAGQLRRCWVRFPQPGVSHPSLVPCRQIVSQTALDSSREAHVQRDHAILSLADRTPSAGALRDRDLSEIDVPAWAGTVELFGIQLTPTSHRLVQQTCWASTHAPATARKQGNRWALFMPDCPIEPGFSGGPILAPQGPLLGVISYREDRVAIGTRVPFTR